MPLDQETDFLTIFLPLAGIVFVIAIGVIVLYQHFRKNLYKQMAEQQMLESKHQNELLRSIVEVQETERKRIAQDMHDELGAVLSIARMQLVQLEGGAGPELGHSLKRVRETTESALATMRRLSHELMPPQLESFGLIKTLETVCDNLNSSDKIRIQLTTGDEWVKRHKSIELALYRVCMELINNTIKHAGAENISIEIVDDKDGIHLNYTDDGKGMDENSLHGLGLRNMEARINAVGGYLQTGNGNDKGFFASVRIPC